MTIGMTNTVAIVETISATTKDAAGTRATSNLIKSRQEPFSLGEKVAVDAKHRFAMTGPDEGLRSRHTMLSSKPLTCPLGILSQGRGKS